MLGVPLRPVGLKPTHDGDGYGFYDTASEINPTSVSIFAIKFLAAVVQR